MNKTDAFTKRRIDALWAQAMEHCAQYRLALAAFADDPDYAMLSERMHRHGNMVNKMMCKVYTRASEGKANLLCD